MSHVTVIYEFEQTGDQQNAFSSAAGDVPAIGDMVEINGDTFTVCGRRFVLGVSSHGILGTERVVVVLRPIGGGA